MYDQGIIEKTTGLVLGFYIRVHSFPKHCTLTNKAIEMGLVQTSAEAIMFRAFFPSDY